MNAYEVLRMTFGHEFFTYAKSGFIVRTAVSNLHVGLEMKNKLRQYDLCIMMMFEPLHNSVGYPTVCVHEIAVSKLTEFKVRS